MKKTMMIKNLVLTVKEGERKIDQLLARRALMTFNIFSNEIEKIYLKIKAKV